MVFGKRKRGQDAQQGPVPGMPVPGMEGIPDSMQQMLAQFNEAMSAASTAAPPTDGTTIPVTPGMELSQALAAAGIANPEQVLGQIPAGLLDGTTLESIEAFPEQTFEFSSVEVQAPALPIRAEFDQEHYGPGDTVAGTLIVEERLKAKDVHLALAYVQQSPSYTEAVSYDARENVHRGELQAGTQLPFSLRIPHDALPNWDPGGIYAALARGGVAPAGLAADPIQFANFGQLYWAIQLTTTRRGMIADDQRHVPIPLVPDRARWPGPPAQAGPFEVSEKVKDWDAELNVNPWSPRRGEDVAVDVTLGRASDKRGQVRVGLVGEIHYDIETESTDGDNNRTTSRSTHIATVHELWQTIDGSQPVHQVRFPIPDWAPFSYGRAKGKKVGAFAFSTSWGNKSSGIAVAVTWKAVVTEDRTMRRNPRRETTLIVRP